MISVAHLVSLGEFRKKDPNKSPTPWPRRLGLKLVFKKSPYAIKNETVADRKQILIGR
jgi:hypothetical protein